MAEIVVPCRARCDASSRMCWSAHACTHTHTLSLTHTLTHGYTEIHTLVCIQFRMKQRKVSTLTQGWVSRRTVSSPGCLRHPTSTLGPTPCLPALTDSDPALAGAASPPPTPPPAPLEGGEKEQSWLHRGQTASASHKRMPWMTEGVGKL